MKKARVILDTPNQAKKILLHSCCAPCAGEVLEAIVHSGLDLKVFFYNPNIHPKEEYLAKTRTKDFAINYHSFCGCRL